jgi:hypothetical protein
MTTASFLELLRELCEHAFLDDMTLVSTFALPVGKKLRRNGEAAY